MPDLHRKWIVLYDVEDRGPQNGEDLYRQVVKTSIRDGPCSLISLDPGQMLACDSPKSGSVVPHPFQLTIVPAPSGLPSCAPTSTATHSVVSPSPTASTSGVTLTRGTKTCGVRPCDPPSGDPSPPCLGTPPSNELSPSDKAGDAVLSVYKLPTPLSALGLTLLTLKGGDGVPLHPGPHPRLEPPGTAVSTLPELRSPSDASDPATLPLFTIVKGRGSSTTPGTPTG